MKGIYGIYSFNTYITLFTKERQIKTPSSTWVMVFFFPTNLDRD